MNNSVSITDNFLSKYFYNLAYESFKKEWRIYSEYNRIIKDKKKEKKTPIKNIGDLNSTVCSDLFKVLSFEGGTDEDFLRILRNPKIYRHIANQPLKDEQKGLSNTGFKEGFLKGKKSLSSKIKELISKSVNKNVLTVNEEFVNNLLDILQGRAKVLGVTDIMELSITGESASEPLTLEIETKGEQILWRQNQTINLIQQIQEEYNLSILKKSNYYIIEPDVTKNEDIAKVFIEKLKNSIRREYPDFNDFPSFFEETLKNTLVNADSVSLLTGNKTSNKIRGDIGEFLVALFNKKIFKKNISFVGDTQTSTGQAAVDLYLKKLGFQVKNFPGQEQNSIISLYPSIEKIAKEDNFETRGLLIKQKEDLYNNFSQLIYIQQGEKEENFKQQIIEILKQALPYFMRHKQHLTLEEISQNPDLRKLSEIKNNIYILNFRIIPASRIFYELAKSAEKIKCNQTIEKLFYTKKEKTKNITDKNNLFSIVKRNLKSLDSFYLYFRGIQFNYQGLKTGKDGNLLSETFKSKISYF